MSTIHTDCALANMGVWEIFWDPITDAQRTVLQLLEVPASKFGAES